MDENLTVAPPPSPKPPTQTASDAMDLPKDVAELVVKTLASDISFLYWPSDCMRDAQSFAVALHIKGLLAFAASHVAMVVGRTLNVREEEECWPRDRIEDTFGLMIEEDNTSFKEARRLARAKFGCVKDYVWWIWCRRWKRQKKCKYLDGVAALLFRHYLDCLAFRPGTFRDLPRLERNAYGSVIRRISDVDARFSTLPKHLWPTDPMWYAKILDAPTERAFRGELEAKWFELAPADAKRAYVKGLCPDALWPHLEEKELTMTHVDRIFTVRAHGIRFMRGHDPGIVLRVVQYVIGGDSTELAQLKLDNEAFVAQQLEKAGFAHMFQVTPGASTVDMLMYCNEEGLLAFIEEYEDDDGNLVYEWVDVEDKTYKLSHVMDLWGTYTWSRINTLEDLIRARGALARHAKLVAAFADAGAQLRTDSRMCRDYVTRGEGHLQDIIDAELAASFLQLNTDFMRFLEQLDGARGFFGDPLEDARDAKIAALAAYQSRRPTTPLPHALDVIWRHADMDEVERACARVGLPLNAQAKPAR